MSTSILCPSCKQPHIYDVNSPCRPFCSDRCQLIDLGAWSQERYRIALLDGQINDDLLDDEELS